MENDEYPQQHYRPVKWSPNPNAAQVRREYLEFCRISREVFKNPGSILTYSEYINNYTIFAFQISEVLASDRFHQAVRRADTRVHFKLGQRDEDMPNLCMFALGLFESNVLITKNSGVDKDYIT